MFSDTKEGSGMKETVKKQHQTKEPREDKSRNRGGLVHEQLIRDRAYLIWQERGCTHGFDEQDWLQAERELAETSTN